MNIIRLLGFYKVEYCSKDNKGNEYDKGTFWEWGIRIKIPFTKKQLTNSEGDRKS